MYRPFHNREDSNSFWDSFKMNQYLSEQSDRITKKRKKEVKWDLFSSSSDEERVDHDDSVDEEEFEGLSSPVTDGDFGSSEDDVEGDCTNNEEDDERYMLVQMEQYHTLKEKATNAFQEANFFEALLLFNECCEINPFDSYVYKWRCQTNLKLRHNNEALSDVKRLMRLEPNTIDSIYLCAKVYTQLGKREVDLNSYSSREFNQDYLTHFQLAMEYCQIGLNMDPDHQELLALMESIVPHTNFFQAFSDEMLLMVFQHLSAKQLCSVASVNKQFNRVSCDNQLWSMLFKKDYEMTLSPGIVHRSSDWKQRYRSHRRATKKRVFGYHFYL